LLPDEEKFKEEGEKEVEDRKIKLGEANAN